MERIEQLVLRFHEQVTPHLQLDGSCVLRRADHGRYAEVPSAEWAVLSCFDGTRNVSEVVREMLEKGKGLGLRALFDRILTLRAEGFLVPEAVPLRPDHKPWRLVLAARLKLPLEVGRAVRIWPWIAAAALSLATAAVALLAGVTPKVRLSGPVLLALWASVAIILSVRSVMAAGVLAQARTRPWRAGVAWTVWVPHLWIDARDVHAAGRTARLALSLGELAVAGLATAAVSWPLRLGVISPDIGNGALAGATATLWWMLRPFGTGPLTELARLITGKETIWQDARSYLCRKLWYRIVQQGELFASETTFLVLALIYPLWGYAGLALFGEALERGLFPALQAALGGTGLRQWEALAVLTVAAVGLGVVLGAPLIGGLSWALRHWSEGRSGRILKATEKKLEAIVQVLASTPLFATLPQDTLQAMACDSSLMDLPDQSFAVRQGTRGDTFFVIRQGRMAVINEHESGRREVVAELSVGDAFGEMALVGDGIRTASVQALGACQVVSLSHSAFQRGLQVTGLKREEITSYLRLAQQLRRSPLFADMSPNEVARFLRRAHRRSVASGEVLIHRGDGGAYFYVVVSGRLVVSTEGRELATLRPGDFAGEISLLAAVPCTATVTAIERSELLQLDRGEFFETLSSNFSFGLPISDTARWRQAGRS